MSEIIKQRLGVISNTPRTHLPFLPPISHCMKKNKSGPHLYCCVADSGGKKETIELKKQ